MAALLYVLEYNEKVFTKEEIISLERTVSFLFFNTINHIICIYCLYEPVTKCFRLHNPVIQIYHKVFQGTPHAKRTLTVHTWAKAVLKKEGFGG